MTISGGYLFWDVAGLLLPDRPVEMETSSVPLS